MHGTSPPSIAAHVFSPELLPLQGWHFRFREIHLGITNIEIVKSCKIRSEGLTVVRQTCYSMR